MSAVVIATKCGDRLFIIVEDTSFQEQDNDCYGHRTSPVCKNYAFLQSTGKSNVHNFKNTFLPFKRIDASGWIHKDGGLDTYVYNVVYNILIKAMESLQCECLGQTKLFLNEFLCRFGCWKQLQISAMLSDGSDIWGQTHMGEELKKFVMNHNYVTPHNLETYINTVLIENRDEELKQAESTSIPNEQSDQARHYKRKKTIKKLTEYDHNAILQNIDLIKNMDLLAEPAASRQPISYNGINNSHYHGGLFYIRKVPLAQLHYHHNHTTGCARDVNEWLAYYSALCEDKDSESSAKRMEAAAARIGQKIQEQQDGFFSDMFSGWKR